ncbi:MAG: hypothetical protein L3K17_03405 [Thermoplasmata archaeon]|nr:hypothetical protein [Thermoplasmata archaeon]
MSELSGLVGQAENPAGLLVAGAILVGLGIWLAARLYWPTPLRYRRQPPVPAADALSELRDARWGVISPVLQTAVHQLEEWSRRPLASIRPRDRRVAARLSGRLRRLDRRVLRRASGWQPRVDFWRSPTASVLHLNVEVNAVLGQVDRLLRTVAGAP